MNLLALEPALLCSRTILVNPKNNEKRVDMGVTYDNIDRLKRKYNLLCLQGNIEVSNNYLSSEISFFHVNKINVLSYFYYFFFFRII